MTNQRLDELDCKAWDAAVFDCDALPDADALELHERFRWPRWAGELLERLKGASNDKGGA